MSEHQHDHHEPTLLDLHVEQTRQATLLEGLSENVHEIKDVLVGKDLRNGIVADVDRLKRSRVITNAVLWFVFTTLVGTTATAIAAVILKQ